MGAWELVSKWCLLSQWEGIVFVKVDEPGAYTVKTGNRKKLQIDLGEDVYKEKMIAFKLDYNTCEKSLE